MPVPLPRHELPLARELRNIRAVESVLERIEHAVAGIEAVLGPLGRRPRICRNGREHRKPGDESLGEESSSAQVHGTMVRIARRPCQRSSEA